MKEKIVTAIILLAVLIGGIVLWQRGYFNAADEQDASRLVEDFGANLKAVSLTGAEEDVRDAIRQEYADFVTPELLARFVAEPAEAPGRLISSPWPEKIEIATVWKVGQAFVVDGEVIYLTSEEVAEGGEAFREKISVALEKRGPKLLIADYDLVPVSE